MIFKTVNIYLGGEGTTNKQRFDNKSLYMSDVTIWFPQINDNYQILGTRFPYMIKDGTFQPDIASRYDYFCSEWQLGTMITKTYSGFDPQINYSMFTGLFPNQLNLPFSETDIIYYFLWDGKTDDVLVVFNFSKNNLGSCRYTISKDQTYSSYVDLYFPNMLTLGNSSNPKSYNYSFFCIQNNVDTEKASNISVYGGTNFNYSPADNFYGSGKGLMVVDLKHYGTTYNCDFFVGANKKRNTVKWNGDEGNDLYTFDDGSASNHSSGYIWNGSGFEKVWTKAPNIQSATALRPTT